MAVEFFTVAIMQPNRSKPADKNNLKPCLLTP
jgi:hypothetical protein